MSIIIIIMRYHKSSAAFRVYKESSEVEAEKYVNLVLSKEVKRKRWYINMM